jgi:hypothetical protein
VISEPVGNDMEITSPPFPPGLVVAPAGGVWDTPTLVVTVTMTAVFMASLGIGLHHFFMTGVNQRGLSRYAKPEFVLTVS